jgi:hypothetical protein
MNHVGIPQVTSAVQVRLGSGACAGKVSPDFPLMLNGKVAGRNKFSRSMFDNAKTSAYAGTHGQEKAPNR